MNSCPAGHETEATDYCDVCGIAMSADGGAVTPGEPDDTATFSTLDPAADGGSDGTCPNCQATNPTDALFCEACGYDFTTGSMPRTVSPPGGASSPHPDQSVTRLPTPTRRPTLSAGWVAEIWIDPDWYADQKSTDPLPSPGVPTVVLLKHASILIGRASRSRNITPDIDLSSDNGISRRHAQLTTDGKRWWVEDLGSSNGTYVGSSVGPLPGHAGAGWPEEGGRFRRPGLPRCLDAHRDPPGGRRRDLMPASRSARERKAAVEAGPLASVKIQVGDDGQFVYKISCVECVAKGHRKWSAYRPGQDNGFMAAMDRWIFHLTEKHPGVEAPCLAYLSAAQERLHQRREKEVER